MTPEIAVAHYPQSDPTRWPESGEADGIRHDLPSRDLSRFPEDQRHMNQLAVERVAMVHQAVFAEAFAMVGGNDHERVFAQPSLVELLQKVSNLCIDIIDRAVIGIQLGLLLFLSEMLERLPVLRIPFVRTPDLGVEVKIRIWWQIRIVCVEVVENHEKWPTPRIDPSQSMLVDLLAANSARHVAQQVKPR